MIYFDIKSSKVFGNTLIAHTQKGICAISFQSWDADEELYKMFPDEEFSHVYSPQYALKIIKQLEENKNLDKINLDIIGGTEFQKLVWEELRKIPTSTTVYYSDIAERIGKPKAVRAVASAVASNPISILIPCHRVVPKSGGAGKYRWGKGIKEYLLGRENANYTRKQS